MIFVLLSTPTCAFIPKYHCLPFFAWCISGSRLWPRFLGGGRVNDGRVHDRAGGDAHPCRLQVQIHRAQYLFSQIVLLQQVAEVADRGLVRHRLRPQVNPRDWRSTAES